VAKSIAQTEAPTRNLQKQNQPAGQHQFDDSTKTENETPMPQPSAISATPPLQSAATSSLDKKDGSAGVTTVSGAVTFDSQNSFVSGASGNGGSVPNSSDFVVTAAPADSFGVAQSKKPGNVTFALSGANTFGGRGGANRSAAAPLPGSMGGLQIPSDM